MKTEGTEAMTLATLCSGIDGFGVGFESDSARYRMCGNAVAVPVARRIAAGIVAAETDH
jgi:hypothetical protein